MEEDSRIASVRKKRTRNNHEDDADFVMLSSSDETSDLTSNKRRKGQSGKIVYDISSDESGEINESGNVKIKNGVIVIDHDDEDDEEEGNMVEVEDEEDATDFKSLKQLKSQTSTAEDPSIFCTPGYELRDLAALGSTMLLAVANPVGEDSAPQTSSRNKLPKKSSMRNLLAKFVGVHLSDGLRAAASIRSLSRYQGELFPRPHQALATFLLAYEDEESRDLAVAIAQSTSAKDAKGLLYRAGQVTMKTLPESASSASNQAKERTNYLNGLDQKNQVNNMKVNASKKLQAGQKLSKADKKLMKAKAAEINQSTSNTDADLDLTNAPMDNTSMPVGEPAIVTKASTVADAEPTSAHGAIPTDGKVLTLQQPVSRARPLQQSVGQSGHDYRSASLTYAPRSTDPDNPFEKFTQPPLPLPEYPILVQELNEEEQLEQKRYFQLNDSDQVACFICDGRGHQEDHCLERTCRHCKAIDLHFAHTCPIQRKCSRCCERGHVDDECTSKLRNTEPPPCDTCSGSHHEQDCPWRFRKMPDPSFALQENNNALLVCCHNCATSRSHLTDDCPIRDKTKQLYPEWSCWSAEYAKHFATAEAWAAAGLRIPGYRGGVTARPASVDFTGQPKNKHSKKAAVAISKLTKAPERARPEYDDFSHLDSHLQHRADTYSPPPARHALPPKPRSSDNYRPQTRGYQDERDDDRYDDYRDRYNAFAQDNYTRRDRYEDDYAPARGHEYGYGLTASTSAPSNANYGYGPVPGSKSGSYHSVPPPQSLESRISGARGGAGVRGGKHAQNNAKKRPIDEARERFASGGGGGAGSDSSSRGGGGGGRGKGRGKGRGR